MARASETRTSKASPKWTGLFAQHAAELAPDVVELIGKDQEQERRSINMIASASYCPVGLRELEGTHLVNRAPMGLPRRRSVANCEYLDSIEELAIGRAAEIFGAEHVNVQALSSTIANVGVLNATLPAEGARILAFGELEGGHISHGSSRHATGANRKVETFGVTADGVVDLEGARKVAKKLKPHMIIAGPSTYPREMDFKALRTIADEAGALLFTDIAHVSGLIAAGIHANPVPYSDVSTTSTQKTMCGPRNGAFIFSRRAYGDAIDQAVYPGLQGPAAANIIAARAVQLGFLKTKAFIELMENVVANAKHLASAIEGAGGSLYTGGTDSHMLIAYAGPKWTQPQLVAMFGQYGVTCNAIRAPGRSGEPVTSIRLGTTAMTIRGVDKGQWRTVGTCVQKILAAGPDATIDASIRRQLRDIADACPVPSYVD